MSGALARLLEDLTTLGYSIAAADIAACDNATQVRESIIAAVPEWPTGYGATNWAAFNDGLTDYLLTAARPHRALVLRGFDDYRRHNPDTTEILIDELARMGRWHLLFGRRLICLVLTDHVNLELGPAGGEYVGWNRHEWLLVHRNSSRIPPWITANKPTDATIEKSP